MAPQTDKTCILVSIINYKTADLTRTAAQSVLDAADATGALDLKLTIVDNASGDGSLDVLRAWATDPRVQIVASDVNGGFSAGHNLGIGSGEADYYMPFNSDAVLRPDFFTEALAFIAAHPDLGLIAPRIEHDDGEQQVNCFRLHTPLSELLRAAQTGPVSRAFPRHQIALPQPWTPDRIEWASFACILIKHDVVQTLGQMDEGYFLYFEDAEYGRRARQAGWSIGYAETAKAVHFRGGSGPVKTLIAKKARLPAYFYRSRSRFFAQTHGRGGLLLANLLWHLGRVIAQSRRLAGAKVPPAVEHEARDIWIGFSDPLAEEART